MVQVLHLRQFTSSSIRLYGIHNGKICKVYQHHLYHRRRHHRPTCGVAHRYPPIGRWRQSPAVAADGPRGLRSRWAVERAR